MDTFVEFLCSPFSNPTELLVHVTIELFLITNHVCLNTYVCKYRKMRQFNQCGTLHTIIISIIECQRYHQCISAQQSHQHYYKQKLTKKNK